MQTRSAIVHPGRCSGPTVNGSGLRRLFTSTVSMRMPPACGVCSGSNICGSPRLLYAGSRDARRVSHRGGSTDYGAAAYAHIVHASPNESLLYQTKYILTKQLGAMEAVRLSFNSSNWFLKILMAIQRRAHNPEVARSIRAVAKTLRIVFFLTNCFSFGP